MVDIVKRAIRTAAAWTANQTAMEALYGVGNYYTLLSTWESAIPPDISPAGTDEQWVAECYGDDFGGADGALDERVTVADRTTSPSNNIIIRAATGQECNGVSRADGGSGFALTNNSTTGVLILLDENVDISRIEVICSSNGVNLRILTAQDRAMRINGCIFSGFSRGVNDDMLEVTAGGVNSHIDFYNNIILGSGRGIDLRGILGTMDFSNNTIHATGSHLLLGDTAVLAINNVVAGGTTIDYFSSFNASSSNNASEDTSAPGANAVTGISLTDGVDFTAPSTGDYSIPTGSALIGEGTDLSADFTTDIAGTTRG